MKGIFKAKHIHALTKNEHLNGRWIEGYLCNKNYIYSLEFGGEFLVDPETVCRYTGRTDKNGKKIWENDILFDGDRKSVVRYEEQKARFVIDDYGTEGCMMSYGWDEDVGEYGVVETNGFDDLGIHSNMFFEVIGNVFDNQELLEKKVE